MESRVRFSTKKLTFMALLTAIALIIFVIESQIPIPIPVPGARLGLANTITLFALFFTPKNSINNPDNSFLSVSFKRTDVLIILICRIILGSIFTGRIVSFIFSVSGGLLAFFVMIVMKKIVSDKQIWVCGAIGAVFHNIGQICAAIILLGTPALAAYLPILIIVGIITGTLTGLVAQFTLGRIV